jgi:AGCS family alanine or glycine:cation symporter
MSIIQDAETEVAEAAEAAVEVAETSLYETVIGGIETFSGFLWGGSWGDQQVLLLPPMVVLLLGGGLYFMIFMGFRPLRRLIPAVRELFTGGRKGSGEGEITPWNALSTALSGQVGTGNLAGVATAITLGGPGAIFWMWITALVGMAAGYAESMLAVRYREKHPDGHFHGGPMYYIKNGLGKGWGWLAVLFCIGALFSALATGNMIQANSITNGVTSLGSSMGTDLPNWGVGAVIAVLVFIVIIGGIKSIGSLAGKVVPFMALAYILCAIGVLIMNTSEIPGAFSMIFGYAFGLEQAGGGIAGYAVMEAVRFGVARGLFSNEAGQGSTPIAHAAAQTDNPVKQGEIAMLGTFIDTIIICTMTALVILVTAGEFESSNGVVQYAWQSDTLQGVQVTSAAFSQGLPGGAWIIAVALALFAFTTLIGWSYYAEQCLTYLTSDKWAMPFRYVWVGMVFIGSLQPIDPIWRLGDIANASMAIPNLIAILLLSGVVFSITRRFDKTGELPPNWAGDVWGSEPPAEGEPDPSDPEDPNYVPPTKD